MASKRKHPLGTRQTAIHMKRNSLGSQGVISPNNDNNDTSVHSVNSKKYKITTTQSTGPTGLSSSRKGYGERIAASSSIQESGSEVVRSPSFESSTDASSSSVSTWMMGIWNQATVCGGMELYDGNTSTSEKSSHNSYRSSEPPTTLLPLRSFGSGSSSSSALLKASSFGMGSAPSLGASGVSLRGTQSMSSSPSSRRNFMVPMRISLATSSSSISSSSTLTASAATPNIYGRGARHTSLSLPSLPERDFSSLHDLFLDALLDDARRRRQKDNKTDDDDIKSDEGDGKTVKSVKTSALSLRSFTASLVGRQQPKNDPPESEVPDPQITTDNNTIVNDGIVTDAATAPGHRSVRTLRNSMYRNLRRSLKRVSFLNIGDSSTASAESSTKPSEIVAMTEQETKSKEPIEYCSPSLDDFSSATKREAFAKKRRLFILQRRKIVLPHRRRRREYKGHSISENGLQLKRGIGAPLPEGDVLRQSQSMVELKIKAKEVVASCDSLKQSSSAPTEIPSSVKVDRSDSNDESFRVSPLGWAREGKKEGLIHGSREATSPVSQHLPNLQFSSLSGSGSNSFAKGQQAGIAGAEEPSAQSQSQPTPPLPQNFIDMACMLQKDSGKGEIPGRAVSVSGRDGCMVKLRQKMDALVKVEETSSTARMKREKAIVTMPEDVKVREDVILECETRSMVEMRMGFLSMRYGILLRWDCESGLVNLIVLRKMCPKSFLSGAPTLEEAMRVRETPRFARLRRENERELSPPRSFSGSVGGEVKMKSLLPFTGGLSLTNSVGVSSVSTARSQEEEEGEEKGGSSFGMNPSLTSSMRRRSMSAKDENNNNRDLSVGGVMIEGGKAVVHGRAATQSPEMEVSLLGPPYCVARPSEFGPPTVSVRVLRANGLRGGSWCGRREGRRGAWRRGLSLPDWTMNPYVRLTLGSEMHRTRAVRMTCNPRWSEKHLNHCNLKASSTRESGERLKVEVFDWKPWNKRHRLLGGVFVPLSSLEVQNDVGEAHGENNTVDIDATEVTIPVRMGLFESHKRVYATITLSLVRRNAHEWWLREELIARKMDSSVLDKMDLPSSPKTLT